MRSTGIRVLSEAIPQHHSPNTLPDTSNVQFLQSNITPSSLTTSNSIDHCRCPSDSCSATFQNSKFENFETPVQQVSNSPVRTLVLFRSQFSIMEADCYDSTSDQQMSRETMDLMHILTTLLHQITNQNNAIQEHIMKNDMTFQRVVQENEDFKRDMHSKLDDICNLLACQNIWSPPNIPSSNTSSQAPISHPVPPIPAAQETSSQVFSSSTGVSTSIVSSNTSSNDIQTQMLLMLSESFSKLSTALTEKKDDQKSEWPKFSGDHKMFRAWYLAVMAQLSLSPWKELYDPVTHDVIKTTTNSTLNGKLYAKLLLSLEGSVLQNVVSCTHLRANGLLLLQDLVNTYKPKNVPEVIAVKTSIF